tara:strand:+ start:35 stop:580 length:546 start_codon:yes stop_codon:yes gene_type:complete
MIFQIQNEQVFPSVHALGIYPFKDIWERDDTPKKSKALQEFYYIEYMCSKIKTNPYKGYDEDLRSIKIIERVFQGEYEPDELVLAGMELYEEWQEDASPTIRFYKAALEGMNQTIKYFEAIDFAERNNSGMPVYKVTDVTKALTSLNGVMGSVTALKQKVEEELFEATKTKGGKEINPFER